MSNKKGEIATILTIGSIIVMGAISVISSFFIKKPQTISSRAYGCSVVNSVSYSPASIQAGQTFTCNANGNIVNQYTMACGWSKNGGWPQGMKSGTCRGNSCSFQVKMEDSIDSNAIYELVAFDYRNECGPNTGGRITLNVNKPTIPPTSSLSPSVSPPTGGGGSGGGGGRSNGCFSLSADFEVRDEGDKKAFYAWVTFRSDKGGDVKLEYNGIHVAGWNRFTGGFYTYSPQWTQPYTHDHEAGIAALSKGQDISFSYRGMHSGCVPQDTSLNCSLGYRNDGSTFVSGQGCSCRNCQTTAPSPTSPPSRPTTTAPTQGRNQTSTPTPITTPGKEKCVAFNDSIICETVCNQIRRNYYCKGNWCCPPGVDPTTQPQKQTPTPTQQTTQTPTPTQTGGTSAPTNTPTSTPECNITKNDHCIEVQATRQFNCGSNKNFPCCQLADGTWVGLVKTAIYPEQCYYYNRRNETIPALIGNRIIKRENGGEIMHFYCKYSILAANNSTIKCNYEEFLNLWNDQCIKYCNLLPTYRMTLKIAPSFFDQHYFEVLKYSFYDEPSYIIFRLDNNIFGGFECPKFNFENKTKAQILQELDSWSCSFDVNTDGLLRFFDNGLEYRNVNVNFKLVRSKSGQTLVVENSVPIILPGNDLIILLE